MENNLKKKQKNNSDGDTILGQSFLNMLNPNSILSSLFQSIIFPQIISSFKYIDHYK